MGGSWRRRVFGSGSTVVQTAVGSVDHYQSLLEDAYTVYERAETMVDELGQVLEYEHTRLDHAAQFYHRESKISPGDHYKSLRDGRSGSSSMISTVASHEQPCYNREQ
jgi:FAD/FMN-containing dehydrogenase